MYNTLLFVNKHGGIFTPFSQSSLKGIYETNHQKPFDGACVGVVAALLELYIVTIEYNPHFFTTKQTVLSASKIINLQKSYEMNPEIFFPVFIRDRLGISRTGYPEQDGHIRNLKELLNKINPESKQNELFLINAFFTLESEGKKYFQEHKLCILKLNQLYIFCEPNYGVVTFNNLEHFKGWLNDEMSNGALSHYLKPVIKSMVIYDKTITPVGLKEGILTTNSIFCEYFPYPSKNNMPQDYVQKIYSPL